MTTKRFSSILSTLVVGLFSFSLCAAVEPGVWTDAFSEAKEYATKTHTPMIVFWGNPGCSQCAKLKTAIAKSDFISWMQEKQYVMVKCEGDSPADYKKCHTYAMNSSGLFPYIALYWAKSDGTTIEKKFSGRSGKMTIKTGSLQEQLMASAEQAFAGWSPSNDDEISFVVTDGASDRLEAVIGETDTVNVPLKRTYTTEGRSCNVRAIYPNKVIRNFSYVWGTEKSAMVPVAIPVVNGVAEDAQVTLILTAEESDSVITSAIHMVKSPENSPANPCWIGERTASSLGWGEWTMDLAVATQKVAKAEGSAYTLILVGGSKWCPDCVNVDRWLLDQPDFKDWASQRRVACVNIDIPTVSGSGLGGLSSYPSLLAYENYTVSDRYVNATGAGEDARVQSGAAYLSRHGIATNEAAEVALRNALLFSTSTEVGGLCRPDCVATNNAETGKFKTGVPCLIVMDKTGKIIGRNFQFNNESPTEFKSAYITRLDELLAQENEPAEELNDSWQTTTEEIPLVGNTGVNADVADLRKSISYTDTKDWYLIDPSAKGSKVQFRLTGDVDAEVRLEVVQTAGKTTKSLGSAKGTLKDGVALDVDTIPSTSCYVKVSAPLTPESAWGVTTGYFALTNETSTVAKYVLSSAGVLQPTEIEQTYTLPDGAAAEVPVKVVSGKVYKFRGNDGYDPEKFLYNQDEEIYTAQVSESVVMKLAGKELTYQIWNTGSVAFAKGSGSVNEPANGYVAHKVKVSRSGGSSSVAKVRVSVDEENSTALDGIYSFAEGSGMQELEWQEGDEADKEVTVNVLANNYADGTQKVTLKLTAAAGTVAGLGDVQEYVLTIADNDRATPGKIGIAAVSPAKSGKTVYARSGSTVRIEVDRVGGADGELGGRLTTTAGTLADAVFAWATRDDETRTAVLSLAGVAASTKVTVALVPDKGTSVVSTARTFTIEVIAEDAPSFENSAAEYTVYRRVSVAACEGMGVQAGDAASVSVAKISGQLPSGVTFGYDQTLKQLVFAGVPTAAAGTYAAYFQVTADGMKGTTACATFTVVDPTKAQSGTGEGATMALNPACAKSRTFSDLQVYSDDNLSRLTGLVTLSLPSSGKLSAKYVTTEGTIAFAASSWDSIEDDGTLNAELVGTRAATAGYSLRVSAYPEGPIDCVLVDPDGNERTVICENDDWQILDAETAPDFAGYYTASLAQRNNGDGLILAKGDGYITLKMTAASAIKKGRMSYAGLLPNGKSFSGSRTLWVYWDFKLGKMVFAGLPVFNATTANDVSGLVYIRPDAEATHTENRYAVSSRADAFDENCGFSTAFVWTSKEGAKVDMQYEAEMDVYGGYYDVDEDFAGCWSDEHPFKTTETLTFFAQPQVLDDEAVWSTNDTQVAVASIGGKNALTLVTRQNSQKLTLSFNRSSGLVSGTLYLALSTGTVKATYRGVVLPGWGTAACAECGESPQRPFVSGACWFKQKGVYGVEGKTLGVSLTHSCPFSIGVEEGK